MESNAEILLTPQQRANKKYYEKRKSDPVYIEKRNRSCNNYYHNCLKHNEDFKRQTSEKKKVYYQMKKPQPIELEVIIE
jgi:hypothetical protein